MEGIKVFASSVSSVSASSLGEGREGKYISEGILGDLFGYCSPAIFCQKLLILAAMCAPVLCVLFLQTEDLAAHLNNSTCGMLLLGEKGEFRCRGEYTRNTSIELPHPDIEIGMCSLPPGLRENVLLCSNGTSEWKVWVKYEKKEMNTMVNTLHLL